MKKILIIENDIDLLVGYTDVLNRNGFEVITALYGDVGINEAITKTPDLILSNTSVPNIDGFGVLSVLSKNAATAHIPFIFVSPAAKFANLRKGMELGADDFVTHPFKNNQLLKAVETQFNKAKLRLHHPEKFIEPRENFCLVEKGIEQLQSILLKSDLRKLKKKQTLYCEGGYCQFIYFLKEGCIKTFKITSDGRQLITNIFNSNSFIGLGYLMIDGPLHENAEAIESSSVYFIAKKTVLDILKKDIGLNHDIIKFLSNDLAHKKSRLVEMAYESVSNRLSKLIIQLNKESLSFNKVEVSRDELAGLAGIASETVSRILGHFKQLGLIEKKGNLISIIDYEGLSKRTKF